MAARPSQGRLLLALLAAWQCVLCSGSTGAITVATGRVDVLALDYWKEGVASGRDVFLVTTNSSGSRIALQLQGPGVETLRTGMRVSVGGRSIAAGEVALNHTKSPAQMSVVSFQVEAEPQGKPRVVKKKPAPRPPPPPPLKRARRGLQQQGGAAAAAATAASLPTVQISLEAAEVSTLVLAFSLEGCPKPGGGVYDAPWYTQEDVERMVFEDASNVSTIGQLPLGALFRSCSHGQSTLTRANSRVAPILQLPCNNVSSWGTPYSSLSCEYGDFVGWSEVFMDLLGEDWGLDVNAYAYKAVVVPQGTACGFVGIGYVGCDFTWPCTSWVQAEYTMGPDPAAGSNPQGMFHEMGHNMFLHHAGTTNEDGWYDEYGDLGCSMGYCCTQRCFNTPHQWQLGWISAQLLDGTSLAPAQTRPISITSHSRSIDSGLKIDPTWAAGRPSLYAGYRMAEGVDQPLDTWFDERVQLYTYNGTGNHAALFTSWLAALAPGESYTHNDTGIVVRTTTIVAGSGVASLTVCRRDGSGGETAKTCTSAVDGDCDGLMGAADPDCAQYLPKPPKPPKSNPENLSVPSKSPPPKGSPPPPKQSPPPPTKSPPPAPPPPTLKVGTGNNPTRRPPAPRPPQFLSPPGAINTCKVGHRFCADVAKYAKQARATANFYVADAKGAAVGMCQYWLPAPVCAGSLVPCACTPDKALLGSGVRPPALKTGTGPTAKPAVKTVAPKVTSTSVLRCEKGHGTCAAKTVGTVCRYWLGVGTTVPTCSGSGIPCSCAQVLMPAKRT